MNKAMVYLAAICSFVFGYNLTQAASQVYKIQQPIQEQFGQYQPTLMHVADQGVTHSDGTTHLDQRFNAADKNHDGGLDREEAKQMPMLSQYFDEVDTNKDGKVTRQEYFDAMPLLHGVKKIDTTVKPKTEPM